MNNKLKIAAPLYETENKQGLKIRNGEEALKVPVNRANELTQTLQQGFETGQPKINKPKFKIFDIPTTMDQVQLTRVIYEQNFSNNTS